MEPQRGEIWEVELDPTRGSEMQKTRPAVVVSSPSLAHIPVRIIVPVTSWRPRFAKRLTMVPLSATPRNGLLNDSAADPLQIRSVALERFVKIVGYTTADEIDQIVAGVAICINYQP